MILADIAATKFVLVGGIVSTGGIFLFSLIFIARDALHKLAGEKYVKKTIIVAAFLKVEPMQRRILSMDCMLCLEFLLLLLVGFALHLLGPCSLFVSFFNLLK